MNAIDHRILPLTTLTAYLRYDTNNDKFRYYEFVFFVWFVVEFLFKVAFQMPIIEIGSSHDR